MPYREVLDRATVLANLALARSYLETRRTLEIGDAPPLTAAEIDEVRVAISESLENVSRIDDETEPIYFSRDPIIGGFQAGVEAQARRLEPGLAEGVARGRLQDYIEFDEPLEPLPVVTTSRLPGDRDATVQWPQLPGVGTVRRFGDDLIRGGAIGVAAVYRAFKRGPSPFNEHPKKAVLERKVRFFITSDWASGEDRAIWLSSRIARRLRDDQEHVGLHVVHLGDIYHAGRSWECTGNALNPWPVDANEALATSWDLNGNHDMYSGGYGYFGTLLADPRFAQQSANGRPTSIFQLENDDWVILGLDTAWTPDRFALATTGGLHQQQRELIKRSILGAEAGKKKVILFSHHQLFSGFDHPVMLEQQLGDFLREHPVHAWFWGHEHVCTLYKPAPEVIHARCVGNGGVSSLVKPLSDAWNPSIIEEHFTGSYPDPLDGRPAQLFGFAILDLDGQTLQATYVDEKNDVWYQEQL